ncbi:hypothetical protein AGMMS49938_16270 [Fibrobacterales bacterium]|nr:hypothetical protein AGMMS49938_16270 [Fibrobacterales bacterium]
MSEVSFVCPHCERQINIEIENQPSREGEVLGFVFCCPHCSAPISWQSGGNEAVELSQSAFENFRKAVCKVSGGFRKRRANSLLNAEFAAEPAMEEPAVEPTLDSVFDDMIKDIRESENYNDFLNKISKNSAEA